MTQYNIKFLLPILIGALSALGFAPFSLAPALIASYGWLFYQLRRIDCPRVAFFLSYLWALGHFVAGLYWIANSTLVDFATWWWAYPIALLALPALLALFQGLAGYIFVKLKLPSLAGVTFVFVLAELGRATLFTGLPWNMAGSTWISLLPIAQNASWLGLYGLTAFTILLAAALSDFKAQYNYLIYLSALVAMYVLGMSSMQPVTYDEKTLVHIVQPNIAQKIKWDNAFIGTNSIEPLKALTNPPSVDETVRKIIIWPETAQASPIWNDLDFQELYKMTLKSWGENTSVITGILDTQTPANAMLHADNTGKPLWSVNKHHLVPFGEYMPFNEFTGLGSIVGIDGFKRGDVPMTQIDGLIPLICYEIIFPDLARKALNADSRAIVTITDDSWFGTSSGPYQHLVQAQFRAIETGLPVVRAANNGISAIIAPTGAIVESTQLNEKAFIQSFIPNRIDKTYFGLHGNLILSAFLTFLVFSILMDKRQAVCKLLQNV